MKIVTTMCPSLSNLPESFKSECCFPNSFIFMGLSGSANEPDGRVVG
jgi:hypothetical protein